MPTAELAPVHILRRKLPWRGTLPGGQPGEPSANPALPTRADIDWPGINATANAKPPRKRSAVIRAPVKQGSLAGWCWPAHGKYARALDEASCSLARSLFCKGRNCRPGQTDCSEVLT